MWVVLRHTVMPLILEFRLSAQALNITGGATSGAHNMTLIRAGKGGAVLDGGDRRTLTSSSHFMRDSVLRDCNRWLMNYSPLVAMAGVGQVVSGSVLADAPQMAVFTQGNLHSLLDSEIRDVVQQCSDCGAYYFGRDWTYRGMRISGCTFTLPGPIWEIDVNCIYADDFGSSVDISHNKFYLGQKVRNVFFSNGGRDHSFTNNELFPLQPNSTVNGSSPVVRLNDKCKGAQLPGCNYCLSDPRYAAPDLFLRRVPWNTSAVWRSTFPRMASFLTDKPCQAAGTLVANNSVCFATDYLVDSAVLASFRSTAENNTWQEKACGGVKPPGLPPPPPPSPTGLPWLRLVPPPSGSTCSQHLASTSSWHHNIQNLGIYAINGNDLGMVIGIDCLGHLPCGAMNISYPVVVSSPPADPETYKNTIFQFHDEGGNATNIRLNGTSNCLVANTTAIVASLDPCPPPSAGGAAAEWIIEAGATATSFVLVSARSGYCVVS
jgi:hypothetical protein